MTNIDSFARVEAALAIAKAGQGGGGSTEGAVRYDMAQTLTQGQKLQAATNIGVMPIAQGADKANQFVVVGTDGNLTTIALSNAEGGSF